MKLTLGRVMMPLVTSALVFAAPATAAPTDSLTLSVSPEQGKAGDEVTIEATSQECDGATPKSDALETEALAGDSESESVSGMATVKDVDPGTYSVSIKCPGSKHTATTKFTVVEEEKPAPTPPAEEPQVSPEVVPQVSPEVVPEGAPETGGGATALIQ